MSDIDDHLTNSKGNHRCNDYRGANNVCVWCEENEAARAELASLRAEVERLRKPPSADPHIKRGSYGEPSVEELVQVYIRAYNKKCTAFLHKIDALDSDAQAGIAAVRAEMIGANLRPYEGALNEIREALGLHDYDDHELVIDEIKRLRTALAEKEKAGVDVRKLLVDAGFCDEFGTPDPLAVERMRAALRTALGAKETK